MKLQQPTFGSTPIFCAFQDVHPMPVPPNARENHNYAATDSINGGGQTEAFDG